MPHNPGSATYPTSSMASEPYPKMPLSGAANFTAEPQEMPIQQQTSMPSVQLSLVAQDHSQQQHQQHQAPPPIRTQFATYGSSAPPHLSLSATSDNSLNVPRYVDSNPRPSKSPRHASHQSVHSASSLSADTASGEYRYGPPTYGGSSELSPQSQGHSAASQQPYGAAPQDSGSNAAVQSASGNPSGPGGGGASSAGPAGPPRDYFPSSQSWTTTAGESPAGDRPYAFPSGGKGPDTHGHSHLGQAPPPPGVYGATHYTWNAA